MSSRRSQRSAAVKAAEAITDAASDRVSRPRRTASENISVATVSRSPASAQSRSPQSMRLTVKTSSSKLREATRSSSAGNSVVVNSRDGFVGGEIIEGKRARNVRKSYVLESDSDEDEEMEDVGDDEDGDAEGESVVEEDEDMDAEDDGLGDEDAEGDIDMDVPPPPPVIKISKAQGRQTIAVKPPTKNVTHAVGQKEMEEASDDEELSELDSDLGEEVEEEEAMQTGNEEDAEGEEEIEIEEDVEDDDDDLDSDDETPAGGSRASTPDFNKLTKRQRARLEEGGSGHLLALPDGKSPSIINELD
jgi:Ino eighty subunit 2